LFLYINVHNYLAYTRGVDSTSLAQFDFKLVSSSGYISLHYSLADKTIMTSPSIVVNEAHAVSSNTKKATKFYLTVCKGIL
jgi:hypothetical protein